MGTPVPKRRTFAARRGSPRVGTPRTVTGRSLRTRRGLSGKRETSPAISPIFHLPAHPIVVVDYALATLGLGVFVLAASSPWRPSRFASGSGPPRGGLRRVRFSDEGGHVAGRCGRFPPRFPTASVTVWSLPAPAWRSRSAERRGPRRWLDAFGSSPQVKPLGADGDALVPVSIALVQRLCVTTRPPGAMSVCGVERDPSAACFGRKAIGPAAWSGLRGRGTLPAASPREDDLLHATRDALRGLHPRPLRAFRVQARHSAPGRSPRCRGLPELWALQDWLRASSLQQVSA